MRRYISLLLTVLILLNAMPTVGVAAADQELASVSVTSDKWQLVPGTTAQLTAVAKDAAGNPISGATYQYLSMDTNIATVDNSGQITPMNYGVIEVLVKATVANASVFKTIKLTAADPSDRETFEMAPGSVPECFASGTALASVSDEVGKNSAMSVKLQDTSTESAALLRYEAVESESLKLVFDVLPKNGAVQFRLSRGGRSTGNTAFWIRVMSNQVQYYNALTNQWVRLGNYYDSIADKWTAVRVEASAVGEAKIYVDGQLIGAAPRSGGSYGTNAAAAIDSVIFECGDTTSTGGLFYIDNLRLAPPVAPADVTFDEPDVSVETLPGYVAHNAAVIATDPGVVAGKALMLRGSQTNTAAPSFQYAFASYSKMALEFDAYIPAANNTVTFQIYNGTKAYSNTAFLLQFNHAYGLRVYNGQWSTIAANVKLTAKEWSRVRIVITTGENSAAKIYLNDVLVGTTQLAYHAVDAVDGLVISAGSATQSCYIDNLKVGAPAEESFDELALDATPETVDGYVAHNAAAVKADPAGAEGKALMLIGSNDNTAAPAFQYAFAPSNAFTLEFDAYIPEANNTVTFQIYNGTKAYSNTAFFLQFNHAYGLRVYNGSWAVVNENAKLNANMWNRVRLEITTGENAETKIYLNGQTVGTTQVAYHPMNTVDGFYIFTGGTAQSCYLDNLKVTAPADITFEELALDATPQAVAGYVAHNAAIVKADPSVNRFLHLANNSGGSTPNFNYSFESYHALALEFDVRIPAANNTVTFQIYNGSKAYTSTAFFLQFNHAYGLRIYNGQWTTIAANAKLTENVWNKVRVEITNGQESQAKIYLNGALVATTQVAYNKKDSVNGIYLFTGSATQSCDIDNMKVVGIQEECVSTEKTILLETQMGGLFDVADNTEKEGFPENDPYVAEDFSSSGGIYGFTQIPNVLYDPDTDLVYVNYNRHRDTVVNYPYDSTRIYNVNTLLNAQAGDQLQDDYVSMVTQNTMFFTAMAKLNDGRIFAQNYMTYYKTDTTATTYSWIINNGQWTRVQGTLTIPQELASPGPQATTNWHRYAFSRCLVELDDGTLLGSMYGTYGAIMVESKDEGVTWNYRSTIADSAIGLDKPYVNTDGTDITWFEPAVTRCADGSLLCVLRTWRDKPLYQTRSFDNGLTWSKPTLMPGLEGKSIYPHLVLLSNGVLAMATGVPGDTIYFSLDGCGYNWDHMITTYSGDTTGNAAIAEVAYDETTDTVTMVALGDRGFNNLTPSGVWGRIVRVTRNHVAQPKIASAIVRSERTTLGLGETLDARVEAVLNTDGNLIDEGYTVQWHSLRTDVAAVDQTGKVTAVGVGTAQIQAIVTCGGKSVMTNTLTLTMDDRDALDNIDNTAVSKWVLQPGETGTVTAVALNCFGQKFVDQIANQEYINGNSWEPKYIQDDVTWSFASLNPELLRVDAQTGSYLALDSGVTDLVVTASKDGVVLTKKITLIIESGQWETEDFEQTTLPQNCIVTDLVSVSTNYSYSGTKAVFINDTSNTLAPTMRFALPESRGVIVEFMLRTVSNEHSPNFGIGHPRADGFYNYACNTAYVGLIYNPLTGAQGFQAFNGTAWSHSNRSNNIPANQWNKIRLEVTTDKPAKFYVNDVYLGQLPVATVQESLNTLCFSTGGAAYTGDAYYIDDIRYMVFD